jgi:hypothetical protein
MLRQRKRGNNPSRVGAQRQAKADCEPIEHITGAALWFAIVDNNAKVVQLAIEVHRRIHSSSVKP